MAIRLPKEKDVLRAVRDWLFVKGVFALRNNSGALLNAANRPVKFGEKGSADLLLCYNPGQLSGEPRGPGMFVAVEVKGPRGKADDDQEAWLAAVRRAGGRALVVRSVGELEAGLLEIDREAQDGAPLQPDA